MVKQLVDLLRLSTWMIPSIWEMICSQVGDQALLDKASIEGNKFAPKQIRLFKEALENYHQWAKNADRAFNDKYKVVRDLFLLPFQGYHN
jgi:hypothetical protein